MREERMGWCFYIYVVWSDKQFYGDAVELPMAVNQSYTTITSQTKRAAPLAALFLMPP
jgi:hypothetical protein